MTLTHVLPGKASRRLESDPAKSSLKTPQSSPGVRGWAAGGERERSRLIRAGGVLRIEGLKDGTAVHLRKPTMEDVDRSLSFFRTLSPDERRYLRVDVTRKEVVEARIQQAEAGDVYRIVALVDDEIVGDGALNLSLAPWRRHVGEILVGEIRVIVDPASRRRWLGTALIRDLFCVAQRLMLEMVVVRIAAPQLAARELCERLGFRVDGVMPEEVEDSEGNLHAMVLLSCHLDEMWKALRDFYPSDNWPDG